MYLESGDDLITPFFSGSRFSANFWVYFRNARRPDFDKEYFGAKITNLNEIFDDKLILKVKSKKNRQKRDFSEFLDRRWKSMGCIVKTHRT